MSQFDEKLALFLKHAGASSVSLSEVESNALMEQKVLDAQLQLREQQSVASRARVVKELQAAQIDPNWRIETLHVAKNSEVPLLRKTFFDVYMRICEPEHPPIALCLYGDYGRGKSHFAGAFAHKFVETQQSVAFYNASHLVNIHRQSQDFKHEQRNEWSRLRHHCVNVELLIIDEIAREENKLTKFYAQTLGELLRERHKKGKSCILVSNTDYDKWPVVFGQYLLESVKHYSVTSLAFKGESLR